MYWRDGYINWRGTKIVAPDWKPFEVDGGATFVIDMKSLTNIGDKDRLVRAVAYLVEGDEFNPNNLITFSFNCKDFISVVTFATVEQVRSVQKKVIELGCS
jgi:hypothetical protein